MEKPCRKLKRLFIIAGTAGAVYAGFKYLLPLAAPFFAGYVVALLLRPSARFLSYRLRITIGGRRHHVPVGLVGGLEFVLLLLLVGALLYWGLLRLWEEARLLTARLPLWLEEAQLELEEGCGGLEQAMGLPPDSLRRLAREGIAQLAGRGREALMPLLMTGSLPVFSALARGAVVSLVACLAAVLSLQEMEELRDRRDQSLFCREFRLIGNRLAQTGRAWFKSQGSILLLTSALCTAGMYLMRNPYYIIAGVGIGLLDALPILGTGTVLCPWALWCLAAGRWQQALLLAALYLVCWLVRELLETHMMGEQVGLSPLETLAAIYVGMELFGFAGFLLGPLGLLLTEDLIGLFSEPAKNQPRY